jgi:hypothetical protein
MADEPLILEIDITAGIAQQDLASIAKSVQSLDAPITKASVAAGNLTRNLRAAGGPADRLYKALQQVRNANMYGDPADRFDANYKFKKAQAAYGKAQSSMNPQDPQSPSFLSKLAGVISSSRFSMGGGGASLMPLVGKTLDLLGTGVTTAVGGLAILAKIATDAAESLTQFRQSMLTSGGTSGETAQLGGIGRIAGISDPAALSRSLADALKDNGAGTLAGARLGVHDYGNELSGPADKAKNLLKIADMIGDRNKTTDEEAIRLARALHVEQLLIYRDVSRTTKLQGAQASLTNAGAHGGEATKQAAEFNAQMGILGTQFDTLATNVGSSLLPVFTDTIALVNDFVKPLSDLYTAMKPLVDLTQKLSIPSMLKNIIDGIRNGLGADNENAARDRHTDAMNRHADALTNGTRGGGERARGAIPSAWGGGNAPNWSGSAAALGAFSL